MAYRFESVLYLWESWGLTDVILPFILIFAVVFAALEKVNVFGPEKKRIHIIIALVLGLTVVIPHISGVYPPEADAVNIINSALPQIAVVIVAIVMLMVLVGLVGGKWTGLKAIVGIVATVILIYIFANAAGWIPTYGIGYWFDDPVVQSIVIIILVFGLAMWLVAGGKTKTPGKNIIDWLTGKD